MDLQAARLADDQDWEAAGGDMIEAGMNDHETKITRQQHYPRDGGSTGETNILACVRLAMIQTRVKTCGHHAAVPMGLGRGAARSSPQGDAALYKSQCRYEWLVMGTMDASMTLAVTA
jgi:hypothetical protein